ncbi:MAG: TonB family protein [Bryobacterales bacterium]|nr:TonB family protein [Bryobacterales bacterium]
MKTKNALVVCLALAGSAWAGEIVGTVYDPGGAVVPGAAVTLVSLADGGSHKTATDAQGDFSFNGFAGGRYRVEVAAPGFALSREAGVLPDVSTSLRLDVVLRLGAVRESMTIQRAGTPGPAPARRVRAGGRVQPPRILAQVRPVYPEGSNATGKVLLHAVILPDGGLGRAQLITAPDRALAQAVMDAVAQWRYQPAVLNGQPVETETMIEIEFRMTP